MRRLPIALVLLFSLCVPASSQTTIGTGPPSPFWSSGFAIGFGGTTYQTSGQTFTVPSVDNVLTQFSFYLLPYPGAPAYLRLKRWTGLTTEGPVLFEGEASTVTPVVASVPPGASVVLSTWSFSGLALVSGLEYVAYLTPTPWAAPNTLVGAAYHSYWGLYSGGREVVANADTQPGLLTDPVPVNGGAWFPGAASDALFSAQFGPNIVTPEPSSVILLGTGLLGLGFFARRQRRDEA